MPASLSPDAGRDWRSMQADSSAVERRGRGRAAAVGGPTLASSWAGRRASCWWATWANDADRPHSRNRSVSARLASARKRTGFSGRRVVSAARSFSWPRRVAAARRSRSAYSVATWLCDRSRNASHVGTKMGDAGLERFLKTPSCTNMRPAARKFGNCGHARPSRSPAAPAGLSRSCPFARRQAPLHADREGRQPCWRYLPDGTRATRKPRS